MTDLERQLEALMFISPDPLPVVRLCELTEASPADVQQALRALTDRHGDGGGALEIVEIGGGMAMRVRAEHGEVCDRLRARPPEERLSPAALETLAVVAYLEPVSRPEIGRLRGVSADATVAGLVERGLLEEAGRPESGGAMRFRTTVAFQERFGLRGAGDLPPIESFELTGPEAEAVRRRLADAGHMPEDADE